MLKLLKKKADPKLGPDYLVLNLGPHHTGPARGLRVVVQLDGETIVTCVPQCGFRHAGIEKMAQELELGEFLRLASRSNLPGTLAAELAMVTAIEALLGVEITERCAYLRVFLAEVHRMAEHLRAVAGMAQACGAELVGAPLSRAIHALDALGARFRGDEGWHRIRPGGLARDLPSGVTAEYDEALERVERALALADRHLVHNRIFVHRTKAVGVLSPDDARQGSLTGPALRATGVAWDVRRDDPYLVYDRLPFDVVAGSRGDAFDRMLVRIEEVRQSASVVRELLQALPLGKVDVPLDLRRELPNGDLYRAVESPAGELGCFVAARGGQRLRRLRLRAPSLFDLCAFGRSAEGMHVSDALASLASFHVEPREVDR